MSPSRLFAPLALATTFGCGGPFQSDTCSGGDNMTNPHLDGAVITDASGSSVDIVWSAGTGKGASLPDAYFAQPTFTGGEQGDDALIASVEAAGSQRLVVHFKPEFEARAKDATLHFTLWFPDRRHHLDCSHAGMDDAYKLAFDLTFDSSGELSDATFSQAVVLGAI